MSTRLVQRGDDGQGRKPGTDSKVMEIEEKLHSELIESLDLARVRGRPRSELEGDLRGRLEEMMLSRDLPLNRDERLQVVDDIIADVFGLGPLEQLMARPEVDDILVNGADTIYVEAHGLLEKVNVRFRDDAHLLRVIDRIVGAVGRRIDESNPMVDARLADGSRVNAIIPPLALDGPVVSIRRFGKNPIKAEDLVRFGSLPHRLMDMLAKCVKSKLNILISGGTGSGKTTLLNVLSAYIPGGERVVTVEDAAELRLQQPHVIRLETRPPNVEGKGMVDARDLVRNALRMRPDRIIVGEVRGGEAIDMLQAMNTGHEGSLCTVHANGPRHALRRIETMVGLGLGNISGPAIREMVADALDVLVQVSRLSDGSRRVVSITEICGMEGGVISTQEIFRFRQTGVGEGGRVLGVFEATGLRPSFADRLEAYGNELPAEIFAYREEV